MQVYAYRRSVSLIISYDPTAENIDNKQEITSKQITSL